MPVSRRRKKKHGRAVPVARRPIDTGTNIGEVPIAWSSVLDERAKLRGARSAVAAERAAAFSEHLIELAAGRTDAEFEDALCERLGPWLLAFDEAPLEAHLSPNDAFDALVHAVADGVTDALDRGGTEPDALGRAGAEPDAYQGPWRVLAALAAIAVYPIDEHVAQIASELRRGQGRPVLPSLPKGPRIAGDVRWARDAYGSRFGILAPVDANGVTRSYLWDVDACGFATFTVFSGYFTDAEKASDAWLDGVGEVAGSGAIFTPVDDSDLMSALLPAEMGFMRVGGESAQQLAEYHRSKRLADVVRASGRRRAGQHAGKLDAANASARFGEWLAEHRPAATRSLDFDETVAELAESWTCGDGVVYAACSPHRVASTVAHVRDYYQDDFAAQLVALLPDWVAFLSDYNGTPAHLARRCVPYAMGRPHPASDTDSYQVRVTE